MGGQAVQCLNKKKFKMLKKKRNEGRNRKKVFRQQHGDTKAVSSYHPSKKKLKKDAKRLKHQVEAEKKKLLASGLISKEDIEKMEQEQKEQQSDNSADAESQETEETSMDVEA